MERYYLVKNVKRDNITKTDILTKMSQVQLN